MFYINTIFICSNNYVKRIGNLFVNWGLKPWPCINFHYFELLVSLNLIDRYLFAWKIMTLYNLRHESFFGTIKKSKKLDYWYWCVFVFSKSCKKQKNSIIAWPRDKIAFHEFCIDNGNCFLYATKCFFVSLTLEYFFSY